MLVRKATEADAKRIHELHVDAIASICARDYEPGAVRAWTSALRLGRYVEDMSRLEFLVADMDRVVGFAIVDVKGAELCALYVSPDAVGRGVGSALLVAAEELLRGSRATSCKLKSTLNAVSFYEAAGFVRGNASVHRLEAGEELACVEMTKSLVSTPLPA